MPNEVCDEILYPFPKSNGRAVGFGEWSSDVIPQLLMDEITNPCQD